MRLLEIERKLGEELAVEDEDEDGDLAATYSVCFPASPHIFDKTWERMSERTAAASTCMDCSTTPAVFRCTTCSRQVCLLHAWDSVVESNGCGGLCSLVLTIENSSCSAE